MRESLIWTSLCKERGMEIKRENIKKLSGFGRTGFRGLTGQITSDVDAIAKIYLQCCADTRAPPLPIHLKSVFDSIVNRLSPSALWDVLFTTTTQIAGK
jgi:hypothetical protein